MSEKKGFLVGGAIGAIAVSGLSLANVSLIVGVPVMISAMALGFMIGGLSTSERKYRDLNEELAAMYGRGV